MRTVLFLEPRGMLGAEDDRLLFWDKFLELGREYRKQHPSAVAERMAPRRRRDDTRLHVGHDGAAEGGDAHQPQLRVLRGQARHVARSCALAVPLRQTTRSSPICRCVT